MAEKRLRPEGPERIAPHSGSLLPATGNPNPYPNTPEGGAEGGVGGYTPLPGGTNRTPEPAPANVGPQQGAGSGTGGLYPNPGEPTGGTIQKGWHGSSYSSGSGFSKVGDSPGTSSEGNGINAPTTFTDL